jgi:hypothetical protein
VTQTTTYLALVKPGGGSTGLNTPPDRVDIDVLNGNFQKIDDFAVLTDGRLDTIEARGAHTSVFNRQMAGTNAINDQTAYVDLPNAPDLAALSGNFVKAATATKLVITISGSAELAAGASQPIYFGIRLNTTDYDVARPIYPVAVARVHFTRTIEITGLAAGTIPFKPRVRSTAAAQIRLFADDFLSITITETM